MNESKVAAALNTISVAFGELAEALTENGVQRAAAPVSAPYSAPSTITMPSGAGLDPDVFDNSADYEALPLSADAPGLGRCPTHGTPWSVKNAGVSKAGKPYNSFWKCDGKDADGTYCAKKPVKSWADAHPLA